MDTDIEGKAMEYCVSSFATCCTLASVVMAKYRIYLDYAVPIAGQMFLVLGDTHTK